MLLVSDNCCTQIHPLAVEASQILFFVVVSSNMASCRHKPWIPHSTLVKLEKHRSNVPVVRRLVYNMQMCYRLSDTRQTVVPSNIEGGK